MADLLTHVLVPFVLLTPLRWRFTQIQRRWIVVGMAGGAVPDLVKIGIVLDSDAIEAATGLPFSYAPISSLGGVLILAGGIAVLFAGRVRQAYSYLFVGGFSALLLDGMRMFADGRADFWLYPVWWRPPSPNLYVSSDPRVAAVAVALALAVFAADRYRDRNARSGI